MAGGSGAARLDAAHRSGNRPAASHEQGPQLGGSDTAADLYPFLVLCSRFTAPALYIATPRILRQEYRRCAARAGFDDPARRKAGFVGGSRSGPNPFRSSEYAKDGLPPLTSAAAATRPGIGAGELRRGHTAPCTLRDTTRTAAGAQLEVNGNMSAVWSRLAGKRREDFLNAALMLADYYLLTCRYRRTYPR